LQKSIVISVPQLIRIVDGQSTHVSTAVLGGLITVLQCGIEDLIAVAAPESRMLKAQAV
jgi:DNA-binding Xre family transcriptional regulator